MQTRLNPYLNFPGTAREAMEFYHRVFGGDLTMNTFGEFGSTEPGLTDQIMHARLESPNGFTLMASDTAPGMNHVPGTNIAISLSGDNADELRGYWEQLSASGSVTMPLEKQMWGDEYGQCVDPYGIDWMVNITQPQA
ncbi:MULTISPECIES: VOC family protein [unclassified Micromonospora]|uniref:VOC family protein n=1 Tax=unclassified Micromonospora TaxID=2617518 RepID=UPI000EF4BB2D|nr:MULTISPECIES: VOC family protein [unclassified Micromonospora]RLP94498.1 VOC family protein [Micromonospora sp. BL4]RLP99649.1 VOC family protein [Micromonospora sp. CV4]